MTEYTRHLALTESGKHAHATYYYGSEFLFEYSFDPSNPSGPWIVSAGVSLGHNNERLCLTAKLNNGDFIYFVEPDAEILDLATQHSGCVEAYFRNGKPHRDDGPAIIHEDGTEEYWKYGNKIDPNDL